MLCGYARVGYQDPIYEQSIVCVIFFLSTDRVSVIYLYVTFISKMLCYLFPLFSCVIYIHIDSALSGLNILATVAVRMRAYGGLVGMNHIIQYWIVGVSTIPIRVFTFSMFNMSIFTKCSSQHSAEHSHISILIISYRSGTQVEASDLIQACIVCLDS